MYEETDRANIENKYAKIIKAISVHDHDELESLLTMLSPTQLEEILKKKNCEIFRNAVRSGFLDFVNKLLAQASAELQRRMLRALNYEDWTTLALTGDFSIFNRLSEFAPNILKENIYKFFIESLKNGYLAVLEKLIALAPDKVQMMIESRNFEAFRVAALNGHLSVLEKLIELAPEKVMLMIESDNFEAFRVAASNGHLSVLEKLIELAPDKVMLMIESYNFEAFRAAASNGHLSVLEKLIELASDKVMLMIESRNFEAFRVAASNAHLSVLEKLIELAPDKVMLMIESCNFEAFRVAASNAHLSVLEKLIELAPDIVMLMIESYSFFAFCYAASNGHLAVLERLIELAPDKVMLMIESRNFEAFRRASSNGHLSVLEKLIELAPDKVQQMIESDNFEAFRVAASNRRSQITNFLISFPKVFAYAEMHQREYGGIVQDFLQSRLTYLRREKAIFSEQNPNAVFDIDDAEQANLYFYMLRNIIRRNDATLLDNLRMLLDIPGVKNLAHQAVTPNEPNELLRLALTTGNQGAADILLNIPSVRALAEQNNYYRNERSGVFDLRALAQDRESSMRALSAGEKKRLEDAINLYQPRIKNSGVAHIISDLRTQLETRYMKNPASIARSSGDILELPMTWGEFQGLDLSVNERNEALKAYYQNKDHTAWRYLSKPNPWMSANASYVYVNEEHTERWSTFEEYLAEISMFYLAATDAEIPAIDAYTLDTRFDHFIYELAMIGRAHNWDDAREIVRDDGQIVREEYDNLQGDKPSCYSGVKRRLFQSVLGHPLLKILTIDDIKQMLREYMREHFQSHITEDNREELALAWNKMIEEGIVDRDTPLKVLDASEEEQAAILELFNNHQYYGAQFREEPSFRVYITSRFQSTPHASYFGGETDLSSLLLNQFLVSQEDLLAIKKKLTSFGESFGSLLDEIQCLEKGSKSQSRNLWQNSPQKLHAIVNAIQELQSLEDLNDALLDDTSRLRVALEIKVGPLSSQAPDEKFIRDILEMTDSFKTRPK